MNISDKVIELIKAEIQRRTDSEEALFIDIEVEYKGIIYFIDFEFKSTASYQERITGAWLGSDTLAILDLTAWDEEGEQLTIDNLDYAIKEIEYSSSWD